MKALVFDGSKAEIRDDVDVRAPGPTEVRVRVVSAGLCHSDLSVIDGILHGAGRACMNGGERLRRMTNGRISTYASAFAWGLVAILGWMLITQMK